MSIQVKEVEYNPLLSKGANEFLKTFYNLIIPSEKITADLPLPANLKITPSIIHKFYNETFGEAILEFNIRSDDVIVCSIPKCGSSWVTNIVWLLTHGLDYETNRTVQRERLTATFDSLYTKRKAEENAQELLANDSSRSLSEKDALKMAWNEIFDCMESPRTLAVHIPVYLLPKTLWTTQGAKLIYIARNPKDTAVSEYYYRRNVNHAEVSMDDVVTGMTNDAWVLAPRTDNIINYWKVKHLPNVFFVAYEDLVNEPFVTIKKMSTFLQCNYTDEQLEELTEYVSFNNMKRIKTLNREKDVLLMEKLCGKKRPDANYTFLRSGKAGAYFDDLTDEQIKKIDDCTAMELKDTDFRFKI